MEKVELDLHVMVDLETMGTGPLAAITAVGAVAFDSFGNVPDQYFYQVVDLESSINSGMKVDAHTILWWMRQEDDARKEFDRKGLKLPTVLELFANWFSVLDGYEIPLWGNGATFDNVVLSSAYRLCGMKQPWSYKADRCYRTLRNTFPGILADETSGTKHNALADAKYQAAHLYSILKFLRSPRKD